MSTPAAIHEADAALAAMGGAPPSPAAAPAFLAGAQTTPVPPAQSVTAPPMRRVPQRQRTTVAPAVTMRQPSIADAFSQEGESIQVLRCDENGVPDELLREFPGFYFTQVGSDAFRFAAKHVQPEYGGGYYLLRGFAPGGRYLGDMKVKVAGAPKQHAAVPGAVMPAAGAGADAGQLFDAFGRAVALGRDGRPLPQNETEVDRAMAQAIRTKQMRSFLGDDDEEKKVEARVAAAVKPLQDALAAIQGQLAGLQPQAPKESVLEEIAKKRLTEDPAEAFTRQKVMFDMLLEPIKLQIASNEKRQDALLEEIRRTGERLTSRRSLREEINEVRELAREIDPPGPQGDGVMGLLQTIASEWHPQNVSEMVDSIADARVRIAHAEGSRRRKGGGEPDQVGETQKKGPPLAKAIPVDLRKALIAAKSDEQLLEPCLRIVGRLWKYEKVRPALSNLLRALKLGDGKRLEKNLTMLCRGLYGSEKVYKDLPVRLAGALLRNQIEVLEMLGIKVERPSEKAEAEEKAKAEEKEKAKPPTEGQVKEQAANAAAEAEALEDVTDAALEEAEAAGGEGDEEQEEEQDEEQEQEENEDEDEQAQTTTARQ